MSSGDSMEVHLSQESFDFQQNGDDSPNTTCLQVFKGLSFQGAIIAAVIFFLALENHAEMKRDSENEVGDVYRSKSIFLRNYAAMERDFKVFVYPDGNATTCYHSTDRKFESKYASEHYFFKNLIDSRFLTDDPREAHFFFIPISCGTVGSTVIADTYVKDLLSNYTYWDRSLGVDHFFVSCHDIGSRAAAEVPFLLKNAIRLVCSPSYDSNYIRQKDIALPQILELSLPPTTDSHHLHGSEICNRMINFHSQIPSPYLLIQILNFGKLMLLMLLARSIAEIPLLLLSPGEKHPTRTKLAFWAGCLNSRVRNVLDLFYGGVQEFEFHFVGKMKRSAVLGTYWKELYRSKFCICPRGKTQVGGVCLAESMTFGCVPVIMSDYYDLPFNDILDWNNFSIIVKEDKVPELEKILKGIPEEKFKKLSQNVLQVHKHFKWNSPPVKYDEFHMVMYELWQRRHIIRSTELPRPFLLSPEKIRPPRTKLGFWAGAPNSDVRKKLVRFRKGLPEFEFHFVEKMKRAAVLDAYQNELHWSKFCVCPRGKNYVSGVCLAESMTFGCIPVILSDYYDLPFNGVVDWNDFSVILKEDNVPNLENILQGIPEEKYKKMHLNLLQVREQLKWHSPPVKYDEFHMVMYELWKNRHIIRY